MGLFGNSEPRPFSKAINPPDPWEIADAVEKGRVPEKGGHERFRLTDEEAAAIAGEPDILAEAKRKGMLPVEGDERPIH